VHKATGYSRAVKVMDKTTFEEEDKDRFLSEIKILRMMDHPNIVKLYEIFQDKRRYYLVTEYAFPHRQIVHGGRALRPTVSREEHERR
jgi:serine/threonine protein kinase